MHPVDLICLWGYRPVVEWERKWWLEQEVMELMRSLDTMDEQRKCGLCRKWTRGGELLSVLIKHLDASPSKNVQAAAVYLIRRHGLAKGLVS